MDTDQPLPEHGRFDQFATTRWSVVRAAIAETVADPDDVEDEMRELFAALE